MSSGTSSVVGGTFFLNFFLWQDRLFHFDVRILKVRDTRCVIYQSPILLAPSPL